eukprot:scaffold8287_cov36-Tisochrysis_lutea.AAC.8
MAGMKGGERPPKARKSPPCVTEDATDVGNMLAVKCFVASNPRQLGATHASACLLELPAVQSIGLAWAAMQSAREDAPGPAAFAVNCAIACSGCRAGGSCGRMPHRVPPSLQAAGGRCRPWWERAGTVLAAFAPPFARQSVPAARPIPEEQTVASEAS